MRVDAWCLGTVFVCLVAILAGTCWLYRARGVRIVPGRSLAVLTYASLMGGVGLAAAVCFLLPYVQPAISSNPAVARVFVPVLIMAGLLLAASVVSLWRCARSQWRSVIFYNLSRDEIACPVAAVLRQLQVPTTHRLRTFRDDFTTPGGRLLVHSAIGMTRLEWTGPDQALRARIIEAVIERLKVTLTERGCNIVDQRLSREALLPNLRHAPSRAAGTVVHG